MAIDKSEEYNIIKSNHEFGKKNSEKISRLTGWIWYFTNRFAAAIHSMLVELRFMPLQYWVGNDETGEPI